MRTLFIWCCLMVYKAQGDHKPVPTKDKIRDTSIDLEYLENGKLVTISNTYSGHYFTDIHTKDDIPKVKGQLVKFRSKASDNQTNDYLHRGCGPVDPSIVPSIKWIALIIQGNCTFNEKLYYATTQSNASAAIIYWGEHEHDNNEIIMTAAGTGNKTVHNAVAISISNRQGLELSGLIEKFGTVNVTLTPEAMETKDPPTPPPLSNTSVLFVSISFVVLIIISLAWLVFYYIQRCRYTNAKERLSRRLANAAKKAIAKIPQRSVKVGDKELDADADQCAVCIEPYKVSDVIRVLPCKHVFHKSCVDPWLLDQRSCPMCKMDILRHFGMHLNDSQESVPQDAESGALSSTPVIEESEPLSQEDEQGAVGGVKIVLFQRPLRFRRDSGLRGQYPGFSSDSDSLSSPVAQCHIECTSEATVEGRDRLGVGVEVSQCGVGLDSEDDSLESHSLITGLPMAGRQVVNKGGKKWAVVTPCMTSSAAARLPNTEESDVCKDLNFGGCQDTASVASVSWRHKHPSSHSISSSSLHSEEGIVQVVQRRQEVEMVY